MQQWGVNYWETYAPVVNWISIRFLLVMAEIVGLESKAIDFVLIFPQADLDIPVYMELPLGMEIPGAAYKRQYVLHLKKNLYGLKQAANSWYDMLTEGLNLRGFSESVADPCVFMKSSAAAQPSTQTPSKASHTINCVRKQSDTVIILVHVDDCIVFSRSKTASTQFIATLRGLRFGQEKLILLMKALLAIIWG